MSWEWYTERVIYSFVFALEVAPIARRESFEKSRYPSQAL